jgi:biopolymer transport protein TolR
MAGSTNRSSMRGSRSRRAMSDINVVPYIDVMLVLLVIFMVTAPLVAPSIVNLPTVGGAAPQQQTPPVVVNIGADGKMSVRYKDDAGATQQEQMTRAELTGFVTERETSHPDQPVVIAADKTVKYEAVMQVMSDLKARGVKRVGRQVGFLPPATAPRTRDDARVHARALDARVARVIPLSRHSLAKQHARGG